ncbi:MAG: hypothetical protein K0R83_542 [Caulobacter sp.]|jgi:hypothetical protein|nr:hypothetical protein [Caulobacter sp.]
MRALAILTAALTLLFAGTAAAADCDAAGQGANFYPLTTRGQVDTGLGMKLMMLPSMQEGLISEEAARRLPKICERGVFESAQGRYRIYGAASKDRKTPPRFAIRDDGRGPVVYLSSQGSAGTETSWFVSVTDGDVASPIVGADNMPTDDQLRFIFASALREEFPKSAGLNLRTGAIILYTQPTTPPKSAGSAPTPPPGGTPGQPMALTEPDGVVFTAAPDGGLRHGLTGMICPSTIGEFQRDRAIIFDAAGGGRDVACRYSLGPNVMTLYLTRYPQSTSAADVFDAYSRSARGVAPAVREIGPPLAVGKPPAPAFEDFWIGTHGQADGLWMVQIDQWFIKVRVTYQLDDKDKVATAADTLFRTVHATVKPPEI